ncbi:MAG: outer membrane lipoprotein-sorting protein [Acidobacteria bacterium]|nr:MAG: outer membrane lipoprotein-sorting protein [Acidobacteriota bacterium]
MFRKTFPLFLVFSLINLLDLSSVAQTSKLTAAQVVEKNVAARGGSQAWRGVHTISWKGKMDAGAGDSAARSRRFATNQGRMSPTSNMDHGKLGPEVAEKDKQIQLPFTYEMKRPRKSRMEIEFAGKTAVQVYDGSNGWKVRPFLNRNDVEPFTADEQKSESDKADLDGYLIDYAAKGSKVELDGMEKVEGRDAYKLKVTSKSGQVNYVWVDSQSFLDVKVSGTPRRMDGKMHNVSIYQRDFRNIQGVMVPYLLETAVDGYRETHKTVIETVAVNPKLEDSLFTKPQAK